MAALKLKENTNISKQENIIEIEDEYSLFKGSLFKSKYKYIFYCYQI